MWNPTTSHKKGKFINYWVSGGCQVHFPKDLPIAIFITKVLIISLFNIHSKNVLKVILHLSDFYLTSSYI